MNAAYGVVVVVVAIAVAMDVVLVLMHKFLPFFIIILTANHSSNIFSLFLF